MENGKGALLEGLKNGIGFGSTEFHVLRAKPLNNPEFIYLVSLSDNFRMISERFFSGSAGQQRVSKDVFFQYVIPLPPLPEQHRIATVLSTLDECIEKTEALIAKLRSVKTGLMQDLLTLGIDSEGRIRDESIHEFKDTEIGRVPVEWHIKKLIDVCSVYSGGTPCKAILNYWGGNTPWFSAKSMYSIFLENSEEYVTDKGVSNGTCKVPPNTILVLVRGSMLHSHIPIGITVRDSTFNQDVKGLIPNDNIGAHFFLWSLLSKEPEILTNIDVTGIGAGKIDTNYLYNLIICIPLITEQEQIVSVLMNHHNRITREKQYRDKLLSQKKGLMTDLLTGRVRVPETVMTTLPEEIGQVN